MPKNNISETIFAVFLSLFSLSNIPLKAKHFIQVDFPSKGCMLFPELPVRKRVLRPCALICCIVGHKKQHTWPRINVMYECVQSLILRLMVEKGFCETITL